MCSFAAVLYLLFVVRFALCERKNELQLEREAPCCHRQRCTCTDDCV